ncbi:hypothetical protein VTN31DRAFT_4073 [Thermomyces dupontii]|uniref:uncharacterized protein n=1 Tax=Talaromyces thermophilus TaxID=28565 RepID=UPI003743B418
MTLAKPNSVIPWRLKSCGSQTKTCWTEADVEHLDTEGKRSVCSFHEYVPVSGGDPGWNHGRASICKGNS